MASNNNSLLSINSSAGISLVLEVRFERIYTAYTYKKEISCIVYWEKVETIDCNSISKALEYYVKGGVYISQVTSFNKKGIEE